MTRPAFDPADSDLFERQEAALSIWMEKLKEKQRLFAEREQIFEGTRLALGGPRRRRVPPPAASPAPDHSPRRVDVSRRTAAASSLASPLLAPTPAASFTEPPTSPWHSGYASHLGSTEATAPEASLFTPAASSSRRKRRTRRPKMDCFQQLPLTVNSGGRKTRTIPDKPASITHPVTIFTPITQPFPTSTVAQIRPSSSAVSLPQMTRAQPTPTPVPATRRRAAATQSTSTPAPVSRVGVTGVQPPPVPVPAPRLRAARTQPDLPKGSEELASPPVSPPLHPPPDPAFHALALSLVRLAEVSPAQAPALLAQAVALSPSLAQSVAQPLATLASAPSSATPPSVRPLASPLQSFHSPAVQPPLQSVHLPAVQLPVQSVHSPAPQSVPVQSPVVQSAPVLQAPVAQSPVPQAPIAQAPIAQGFRTRWPSLSPARGLLAYWPSLSPARGLLAYWPSLSPARGLRAYWPSLSPARGLRAYWPSLRSCCSVTAGFHAVAWSSLGLGFCFAWSSLGFAQSSFCLCVSLAWSCGCHAVAQATFWTPPPSSSRPPTGPSQWPPPSSSRPPTGPSQWPPPSSSRPPTGSSQWPPPSSSLPPTGTVPAQPLATWPPTGTVPAQPLATWPPTGTVFVLDSVPPSWAPSARPVLVFFLLAVGCRPLKGGGPLPIYQ
ncbi:unnamed protein product [Oreochromis niloticus]|nr:unnamed protein product [Mustela putorius furo]